MISAPAAQRYPTIKPGADDVHHAMIGPSYTMIDTVAASQGLARSEINKT